MTGCAGVGGGRWGGGEGGGGGGRGGGRIDMLGLCSS